MYYHMCVEYQESAKEIWKQYNIFLMDWQILGAMEGEIIILFTISKLKEIILSFQFSF
jgi:hypothetical protein